ncbi:hypothetical protein BOTBODRAFT_422037 [Botryobasidium botryosum FD-172 SS1]|uniref:Uncharacterized protein n=1 Tax=Botryobasidium botryosum (strain FD-172 SS1) TaxID=930990 RepID=A0A067MLB1_BOTB1|nr:hypothetical protein BOTBODRAFT_422037 [Botryobasidium botryosum FD-172 SS1]
MMALRKTLAEKDGVEPDEIMSSVLIDFLAETLPSDRQTFISVIENYLFALDNTDEDAQSIWARHGSQFLNICTSQRLRARSTPSRSNPPTTASTKTIDHSKYEFQAGAATSTAPTSGKGRGQPRSYTIKESGSSVGGIRSMPVFKRR